MVQRREGLRFTLKVSQPIGIQPIGIVREGVRKNLDRDVAIQLRVAAHALANGRCDVVDAEAGAGREGQFAVDYMGGTGGRRRLVPVHRQVFRNPGSGLSERIGKRWATREERLRGSGIQRSIPQPC